MKATNQGKLTSESTVALRLFRRNWRANEYIESHLTTPFSEKDVADAAGVSVGYLNTLSKGEVGCTLHRYILEKRLGLAQSLLSSSEP